LQISGSCFILVYFIFKINSYTLLTTTPTAPQAYDDSTWRTALRSMGVAPCQCRGLVPVCQRVGSVPIGDSPKPDSPKR